MTKLTERKTRLTFVTNEFARYRARERAIVIEVSPHLATCRLAGSRIRYEISWRGVYDRAAEIAADRARAEKKARRLKVSARSTSLVK